MSLQSVQVDQDFMKWELDFIEPISPSLSVDHGWVLTTKDYFTRWTKFVALKYFDKYGARNFYEDIITRFGVPDSIISNNALFFWGGLRVFEWVVNPDIYLNTSSYYYP